MDLADQEIEIQDKQIINFLIMKFDQALIQQEK